MNEPNLDMADVSDRIHATVLIPVKNGGDLFVRVLERVMTQETPWPYEVLVIDSGSRDGSVDVAKNLGARVVEIAPQDFGHGKTRNLGVSLAQGDYVAVLTHDALPVDEHWLKNLVEATSSAPDVAGAFGRHLAYDHASIVTRQELKVHFAGFGDSQKTFRLDDPERYQCDEGYRQFLHFFSDNNACLRREVWRQFPYPEVDFAEDQAWAKQVIEAGFAKVYVPEAAVYHSHDFGFVETGRRAYDEARALNRLFGYRLVRGPFQGMKSWAGLSARNVLWIIRADAPLGRKLRQALAVPFLMGAKIVGLFLGEREDRLPDWLVGRASRDRALQKQG
ncbi:MAG: glycosyltransferase family 2 protein [Halothiobacillaceae bacterium]